MCPLKFLSCNIAKAHFHWHLLSGDHKGTKEAVAVIRLGSYYPTELRFPTSVPDVFMPQIVVMGKTFKTHYGDATR